MDLYIGSLAYKLLKTKQTHPNNLQNYFKNYQELLDAEPKVVRFYLYHYYFTSIKEYKKTGM